MTLCLKQMDDVKDHCFFLQQACSPAASKVKCVSSNSFSFLGCIFFFLLALKLTLNIQDFEVNGCEINVPLIYSKVN